MPLNTPAAKPKFRVESFWPNMSGFHNYVSDAWNEQIQNNLNPLKALHVKLSRTAKALRNWSKHLLPQDKLALAVCREVIG
jgi:hypothetical protein